MRIVTLDYLRGIAAFGIMIYHYYGFKYGKFDVSNPLEKIGFYGVSLFYIISGLTLYCVYHNKELNSPSTWKEFYVKRAFRIFPLLWVAIILTLLLSLNVPETKKLILNFTGLFGFVDWNSYIAMGSWSIGNELVFYSAFPLLLLLVQKNRYGSWLLIALVLFISVYFSLFLLDANTSVYNQWRIYSNPLNQIPYFISGILIGHFSKNVTIAHPKLLVGLVLLLLIFFMIPVSGNAIQIVSGMMRIVYFLVCTGVTAIVFYSGKIKQNWIHKPLFFIGETSYGIYLYHPIVYIVVKRLLLHVSPDIDFNIKIGLSIVSTLIISHLSFIYLEKPMSNFAKSLVSKKAQ